MGQELEILESFVLKKINPSLVSCISGQLLEEFQSGIINEKAQIQDSILKTVLELKKDHLIRIYIHNYQKKLVSLSNSLYDYLKEENPLLDTIHKNPCLLSIQKSVYFFVLELLSFIETSFPKYINSDSKIPDGTKFITIHQLKGKLRNSEKIKNSDYNELIAIATEPLKEFFENHICITSGQLHYYNVLANVCSETSFKKEPDPVMYLSEKLIFINFNSTSFFYFYTGLIKKTIKSMSTCSKLEKLAQYLKIVNQAPINPKLGYIKNTGTIKDMLAQWIIEEIIFYEKLSKNRNEINPEKDMDFKITTCFSVSQLACFLKILVETGIISNHNDMDIIRFFATVTQSKRTESISFNSLRTKYYNIEEKTRDEIKDYVIKMLNDIHRS